MAGPALDALLQDRAGNRHSYSLPPGAMQDIEIRALKVAALNQLTPALAGLVTMTPNPFLQLKVVAHSGGMLAGAQAQMMSAEWRDFIRPHEERITALSGQKFSEAYQEGTQFNYDVKLDSGPPTAAMLAAESLAGAGLDMLKRLQTAYYAEGRQISEREELVSGNTSGIRRCFSGHWVAEATRPWPLNRMASCHGCPWDDTSGIPSSSARRSQTCWRRQHSELADVGMAAVRVVHRPYPPPEGQS